MAHWGTSSAYCTAAASGYAADGGCHSFPKKPWDNHVPQNRIILSSTGVPTSPIPRLLVICSSVHTGYNSPPTGINGKDLHCRSARLHTLAKVVSSAEPGAA